MTWSKSFESRFLRVDPAKGRFLVSRGAFTDPAVFKEEKERILKRSWVFLGHDSEIRNPNDYITRRILDFNLIFCRDRAGAVHAFMNSCTHRGATICRDQSGNRKSFTCPYHGWTFSNGGKLLDGQIDYVFHTSGSGPERQYRVAVKRATLDLDSLVPQGKVTIIL